MVTVCYICLQWVTYGNCGLHMVTVGYIRLHKVTVHYIWLQCVTSDYTSLYIWLQWLIYDYSVLHMVTVGIIWLYHITYGYNWILDTYLKNCTCIQKHVIIILHFTSPKKLYMCIQKTVNFSFKPCIYLEGIYF